MDYESEGLLHEMFRRQAAATPDKVAVIAEDGQQLTFRELDHQTDVLAMALNLKGVVPGTSVCIYMEKCIAYTISYIAILKAGE